MPTNRSVVPGSPRLSTYSIVGVDPLANEAGVAVQSKFLAVGAFVPWARGGTGAAAVQAYPDITHGTRALDLIDGGSSPKETLEVLLQEDELRDHRQIGLVASDGRSASFTGENCFEFAKSVAEDCFSAQGNILRSPEVVDAMAETFKSTEGNLGHRLLTALEAAEAAGGEKRGVESAALIVVKPNAGYGGNHDRWLDLRVDHSDQPIEDLRALFDLHNLYFGKASQSELLRIDHQLAVELTEGLSAIGWWDTAKGLRDNLFSWMGWHNLEERQVGEDMIDPLVLNELRTAIREKHDQ